MAENISCLVAALGLYEHEISLLKSIFKVGNTRDHIQYELIQNDIGDAHIILVTIDNEAAMDTWQQLPRKNKPPVMLAISPMELGKFHDYSFSRPFSPSKILGVLDKIVKIDLSDTFVEKAFQRKEVSPQKERLDFTQSGQSRYRALVIDDSKTVQKQLASELTSFHLLADIAETGEQGLDMAGKEDYDIIFLDVVLPGIDGYQVCKSIKRIAEKKHIPIVMLTSKSSPFDRVRGSVSGCNEYLTKPVDIDKFHQILDKYITRRD